MSPLTVFGVLLGLFVLAVLLWAFRPRHRRPFPSASKGLLSISKQLNVGATSTATVTYQDPAGTTVPVSGAPTWSVDNNAVATVVPAADGMSAVVTGVAVGTATVTVKAEGDPVAGVDTITLEGTVSVVDEASTGTLTFS